MGELGKSKHQAHPRTNGAEQLSIQVFEGMVQSLLQSNPKVPDALQVQSVLNWPCWEIYKDGQYNPDDDPTRYRKSTEYEYGAYSDWYPIQIDVIERILQTSYWQNQVMKFAPAAFGIPRVKGMRVKRPGTTDGSVMGPNYWEWFYLPGQMTPEPWIPSSATATEMEIWAAKEAVRLRSIVVKAALMNQQLAKFAP